MERYSDTVLESIAATANLGLRGAIRLLREALGKQNGVKRVRNLKIIGCLLAIFAVPSTSVADKKVSLPVDSDHITNARIASLTIKSSTVDIVICPSEIIDRLTKKSRTTIDGVSYFCSTDIITGDVSIEISGNILDSMEYIQLNIVGDSENPDTGIVEKGYYKSGLFAVFAPRLEKFSNLSKIRLKLSGKIQTPGYRELWPDLPAARRVSRWANMSYPTLIKTFGIASRMSKRLVKYLGNPRKKGSVLMINVFYVYLLSVEKLNLYNKPWYGSDRKLMTKGMDDETKTVFAPLLTPEIGQNLRLIRLIENQYKRSVSRGHPFTEDQFLYAIGENWKDNFRKAIIRARRSWGKSLYAIFKSQKIELASNSADDRRIYCIGLQSLKPIMSSFSRFGQLQLAFLKKEYDYIKNSSGGGASSFRS